MTVPITYKPAITTLRSIDGPGSFYRVQVKTWQAKPYDLPLPYTFMMARTGAGQIISNAALGYPGAANSAGSTGAILGLGIDAHDYWTNERTIAEAECAHWLKSSVMHASAELLMTFAERQKSIDMIALRGSQLLQFLTNLRTGRLKKARENAQQFGWIKPGAKRRKPPRRGPPPPSIGGLNRDAANLLLEMQFGWGPLIESVQNACKVLSSPIKTTYFEASGKCTLNHDQHIWHNPWAWSKSSTLGRVGCKSRGHCYISNPNLYLANRLGVLNPMLAFWDAIPLSFIWDWLINVNGFLASFNEYAGVSFIGLSTTVKYKAVRTSEFVADEGFSSKWHTKWSSDFIRIERSLGLPPVKLHLRRTKLNMFHVRTIWALVVQRL